MAKKGSVLINKYANQLLAPHNLTTDANFGSFAPAVAYGTSMHREMEFLVKFGMTPTEVLVSTTSKTAEVFGIDELGTIKEGNSFTDQRQTG